MQAPTSDPLLVLVAEDEFLIGDMLEEAIAEAGFRVLRARDGIEAWELVGKHSGARALVTDIRLERGPNGWELARHARRVNPDLAVVYTTGDSASEWRFQGVTGSVVVPKPFLARRVVDALRKLLGNADDGPLIAAQIPQIR